MNLESALTRTRQIIRLRHYSLSTEESYCGWIARYWSWLQKQATRRQSSEQKFEAFLTHLAKKDVSVSTQNQAFGAIRFLYVEVLKHDLGKIDGLRARRDVQAALGHVCIETTLSYLHTEPLRVQSPLVEVSP